MVGKDPVSFFCCAACRYYNAGCGLKGGQTVFTKAGFWKDWLWVFELGVPVQIIHPYAVQLMALQKFSQGIPSVYFESGFRWANSHKPGSWFHFITVLVNRPSFRVFIHIRFSIQGGKLCEYL